MSTETTSNRLIVIAPFNWMLLNLNDTLYVIDQVGTGLCPVDNTTAYQITEPQIYQICLSFNLNAMLNVYTTTGKHYLVPYEINDTVFTVLSAINELSKTYLQFNPNPKTPDAIKIEKREFEFKYKHVPNKTLNKKRETKIATAVNNYYKTHIDAKK